MLIFNSQCFNSNYLTALSLCLMECYKIHDSRVGECIYLGKAIFTISPDDSRLIFLKNRKQNLQFAIQEAIWILKGDNSLNKLKKWIDNYIIYSDDQETLNGAYGFRLKKYFGKDQIDLAIENLKKDPNTRRVVLTIYSINDLDSQSKDIPCNTHIYLQIIDNKLNITVCNRSNDLYLGIPYNIFVFGILQKYIALKLNINIGKQIHFTNNLHCYIKDKDKIEKICKSNSIKDVVVTENDLSWNYSNKIIENMDDIDNENYINIQDHDLKNIFSKNKNLNNFVENVYNNFYQYNLLMDKEVMSNFEEMIFKNHREIIEFVDNKSIEQSDLLSTLINNFNTESKIYTLNTELANKIKIGIILNSIWQSMSDTSIIRDNYIGEHIQQNWNLVLNHYDLEFKDILSLPIIPND